jgi:hypothetical protein
VIIEKKDADLRRVSSGLLAHWLVHLAPAIPRGTARKRRYTVSSRSYYTLQY